MATDSYQLLRALNLGDIVSLPDGREQTVRAMEQSLATPVGQMAGWVLAGEVGPQATLLAVPSQPNGEVVLYTPLEDVPPSARSANTVVEGVVSYWAPHLPGLSGAMGELGYKVCSIRASREPMVLLWRGREMVVFVKSAVADPDNLRYLFLQRDPNATERDVTRHSATVVKPGQPRSAPSGAPTRHAEPAKRRIPLLPGRRR
jgi:hypothetical protein